MKSKVVFRYSDIYDMNLAKWMQEEWTDKHRADGINFAEKVQKEWNNVNGKIFSIITLLGFIMPEEVIAYVVSPWNKVTSFSDPLTFAINNNMEEVFSTICHELIHVALSYKDNKELKRGIYLSIQNRFPKEYYVTRMHIAVNFLQKVLLKQISINYELILEKDKNWSEAIYPGLKRAWYILDFELRDLDDTAPIISLTSL